MIGDGMRPGSYAAALTIPVPDEVSRCPVSKRLIPSMPLSVKSCSFCRISSGVLKVMLTMSPEFSIREMQKQAAETVFGPNQNGPYGD